MSLLNLELNLLLIAAFLGGMAMVLALGFGRGR